MTKVISTIGPESEGSKTEFFINNSDVIRLNLSHNDISWHEKNIKLIKKINSNRLILFDLPGIKPQIRKIFRSKKVRKYNFQI